MKIVIPELNNSIIQTAIQDFPENVEFLPADSLDEAAEILKTGQADSIVTGIDYPTRDVILTCKNHRHNLEL